MSKVRQLSVFIANEAGRVSEVTRAIGNAGVSIRGFSVSDTADFGILRLVVDDPDHALAVLDAAGFTVRETQVICVLLPDHPGGLADVLTLVADAGVNVEYVYSLTSTFIVLNVTEVDRALELLADQPVHLVSQEEISAA